MAVVGQLAAARATPISSEHFAPRLWTGCKLLQTCPTVSLQRWGLHRLKTCPTIPTQIGKREVLLEADMHAPAGAGMTVVVVSVVVTRRRAPIGRPHVVMFFDDDGSSVNGSRWFATHGGDGSSL